MGGLDFPSRTIPTRTIPTRTISLSTIPTKTIQPRTIPSRTILLMTVPPNAIPPRGGGALDQRSDGGVRTENGKTHPPIHIFSEIRPISTDFLTNIFACFSRFFLQLLDDYWKLQLKVETFDGS